MGVPVSSTMVGTGVGAPPQASKSPLHLGRDGMGGGLTLT